MQSVELRLRGTHGPPSVCLPRLQDAPSARRSSRWSSLHISCITGPLNINVGANRGRSRQNGQVLGRPLVEGPGRRGSCRHSASGRARPSQGTMWEPRGYTCPTTGSHEGIIVIHPPQARSIGTSRYNGKRLRKALLTSPTIASSDFLGVPPRGPAATGLR